MPHPCARNPTHPRVYPDATVRDMKRDKIQKQIAKKMRKIQKLQSEIYWLARKRDNIKPKACK